MYVRLWALSVWDQPINLPGDVLSTPLSDFAGHHGRVTNGK